jgi:tight adherence protein B
MPLVALFVPLLLLNFLIILYLLRPSPAQSAMRRTLEAIKDGQAGNRAAGETILKVEGYSPNPVLGKIIREIPGAYSTLDLIRQCGQDWPVSRVMGLAAAAAALAGWGGFVLLPGNVFWVLVALLVGSLPYIALLIMREARFRKCDRLLPEAIDLMARGLRAGHALPAVLDMVSREIPDPIATEFRRWREEYALGVPLRDATLHLVDRLPRDDVRFLASAILLHRETGGNLAGILDKTAHVARERVRLRGQLKIYTAQGRLTGWLLCALPLALFLLLSVVSWDYEKLLFAEPMGRNLVYTGLVTMCIGVLVIRRIIDIKV